MNHIYFSILNWVVFSLLTVNIQAQSVEADVIVKDGIYSTSEALGRNAPTNTMGVKKVALTKKMKREKQLGTCYFEYEVNKQKIKTPYCIVKDGDRYISANHIRKSQEGKFKKWKTGPKNAFYKVKDEGKFWYIEGMIDGDNSGVTVGAILGGLTGALIGAAIDGKQYVPIAIVYNKEKDSFQVIQKCAELESFAKEHGVDVSYNCKIVKETHPKEVHRLIKLINEG